MRWLQEIKKKTGISPAYLLLIITDLSVSLYWYFILCGYTLQPKYIDNFTVLFGDIIILKMIIVMITYFTGEKIEKK